MNSSERSPSTSAVSCAGAGGRPSDDRVRGAADSARGADALVRGDAAARIAGGGARLARCAAGAAAGARPGGPGGRPLAMRGARSRGAPRGGRLRSPRRPP